MAPTPRFIIRRDATPGHWCVVDRLLARVPYFSLSLLSADHHARDEEDRWRARCQQWIEAEWRGALL